MLSGINFDIWSIIFLMAASQGLFLSFTLFFSKSGAKSLLALLTLLFSICLIYYVAYWINILDQIPRLFDVIQGFTYLFGPLVYLYIKSNRTGVYIHWKHFLAFGVYLVYFVAQSYYPDKRIAGWQILIQNSQLVVYVYLIYRLIQSDRTERFKKWRLELLIAYTGYVLSFICYYILVFTGFLKIEYDYMISLASSGFIYFVGYKGLVRSDTLKNYDNQPYRHSSLSGNASYAIMKAIKEYFEAYHPYLKSDFKLTDLAKETRFSAHHISQSINEVEGVSFSVFVNQYRFRAARQKLCDDNSKQLRIIDIAYDCGFNNKTTFSTVFKRYEGITPSEYRKLKFQ
ncbi:AraC family transcriptional regulator [Fulvivirga sp. M361]|uniref:helix-turn-helix domain-containing protein n=1 Tax=Fulvivirga sp. M361 TaxID=2594266 RepID=UPI001179EE46|nr:helix-turn-helix domain-containing protein [Fulvivirga sp. M361]TRX60716.1 AraC family transcriptional regulator [Fulvivirga sp. M361]